MAKSKEPTEFSVETLDAEIDKIDAEIDKHGTVIAGHMAKIKELNAQKDEKLQIRNVLVRLGVGSGLNSEQAASIAQTLSGAGGIESAEAVGNGG